MLTVNLTYEMDDREADKLAGTLLDESAFDTLIQQDANVYKPNGDPLIVFRKGVLPRQACETAYVSLRDAAVKSENRGVAGGPVQVDPFGRSPTGRLMVQVTPFMYADVLADGTVSKTHRGQTRLLQFHKRRAAKLGGGGTHTADEWDALLHAFGGVCLCCGTTNRLTRDHVVPLTRGGTDLIENIQPLCHSCNSSKGARTKDYRNPE